MKSVKTLQYGRVISSEQMVSKWIVRNANLGRKYHKSLVQVKEKLQPSLQAPHGPQLLPGNMCTGRGVEKEGQGGKGCRSHWGLEELLRTHSAGVATDYPSRNAASAIFPDGYGQREIFIEQLFLPCGRSRLHRPSLPCVHREANGRIFLDFGRSEIISHTAIQIKKK